VNRRSFLKALAGAVFTAAIGWRLAHKPEVIEEPILFYAGGDLSDTDLWFKTELMFCDARSPKYITEYKAFVGSIRVDDVP
jgi:hypothetical protein